MLVTLKIFCEWEKGDTSYPKKAVAYVPKHGLEQFKDFEYTNIVSYG